MIHAVNAIQWNTRGTDIHFKRISVLNSLKCFVMKKNGIFQL